MKDFFSSKSAWGLFLGLIAVLAVAVGALLWFIQFPDQKLANLRTQFEELRSLEAKWDNEILSVQLGIASDYDVLTHTGRQLVINLEELQASVASDMSIAALEPSLKAYGESIAQKSRLADQIKASYAMLRNSATVVPNAISEILRNDKAHDVIPSLNRYPADFITETMTGMVSYTISPSVLLRDTVQNEIQATRSALSSMPAEIVDAVNRFLAQVEVVIQERQRGNELMLAINDLPTDTNGEAVQSEIANLAAAEAGVRSMLWTTVLLLSALLLITIGAFVLLQWQRFTTLNRHNRMLHQKNEDAEQQIMQSSKLSALGQMVAGITHEINTPLAYVRAVFELIKERVLGAQDGNEATIIEDEERIREHREELRILLDDGLHGLDEIATLVRTMKNFSRLDKGQIESFSIEEGIENALLIARPQLKYVADVKLEFDKVPDIVGSPSQLRQVLLNLIMNASQAMGAIDHRGVLTLRTRLTSADTVEIDVCDNGPGIPDEVLGKIFDPFFTTKPVGEGTGMGLSICYRIIENHGGTIAVNSKVGKGTVFTVTLPRQGEKYGKS